MSDIDMVVSSDTDVGTTTPPPTVGCLVIGINDPRGNPIPNLEYQVLIQNKTVYNGKTDADGKGDVIDNLKLGSVFDIQVKTDKGLYKKVATGSIQAEQNVATLTSPKTRFEFSTYLDTGKPGKAIEHRQKVIESHNQEPASTPTTSGNEGKKPTIKDDRNDAGQPVAIVVDGTTNWYGVNNGKAVPPSKDALGKLNTLVDFMEHQAKLDYKAMPQTEVTENPSKGSKKPPKISKHDVTTADIITQMINKKFKEPKQKLFTASKGWCAKYVKVGLWYAGYGPATEPIGNGTRLARSMGNDLVTAGFKNISATLPKIKIRSGNTSISQPDITYVLPGDVIVYEETAAPNAAGHIDVRTYHGFISDFVWPGRNGFPNVKQYTVLGVYRKYSDTLAEARVKAFLKIIREHETEGFEEAEKYFALPDGKDKETGKLVKRKFKSDDRHPFDDDKDNLPFKYDIKDFYGNINASAGAYQLDWRTFNRAKEATGWPASFKQADQDRAAIYELQGRSTKADYPKRTALGYIMEGKIEQAVNDTKLWELFGCLPGGKKAKLKMEEFKNEFDRYAKGFSK